MSTRTQAGSTYTIDRGTVAASIPGLSEVTAELALDWRRATAQDAPIAQAGWLQPGAENDLAVAGSAALAWLESCEATAALGACHRMGLHAVLTSPEHAEALDKHIADLPVGLAITDQSPAATLLAVRDLIAHSRAPTCTVYGVLAEVFELGVLIVGPAGVGKSELALELLGRGHRLVADDVVEIRQLPGGLLVGQAPELLRGFLEVRGLGVLDVARMYGQATLVAHRRVDFMLELLPVREAPTDYRARLAGLRGDAPMLERSLPTICLPIRVGHNLGTLVEAACRDQWLRLQGYCAEDAFAERQQRAIDAQTTAK